MKRTAVPSALLLAAALATLPAAASAAGQFGWLRASPLSVFTEVDWEMLRKNARGTLDESPDGTTSSWENPDTGHSGSVTVLSTYEEDGRRCRKAKFTNEARGMTGIQTHRLCKVADGTWKIAP
jgi:surface antigen